MYSHDNENKHSMLCSVLIAALVAALVVVPFRRVPQLIVAAALALLVFWSSRAPNPPDDGIIRMTHVPLGTVNPQPAQMLHIRGKGCWDLDAGAKCVNDAPARTDCWDHNSDGDEDESPKPRPIIPPTPKNFPFACWDTNGNYVCDASEDVNGDGRCDHRDCLGPTASSAQTITNRYGIYVKAP